MQLSILSNWLLSNYSTLSSDCLMLDVPQTILEKLLLNTTVFNGVWFVVVCFIVFFCAVDIENESLSSMFA